MAITIQKLIQYKQQNRPIVVLTAWDYLIAQLLDNSGVDLILVGDSMSVVLGYQNTLPISLEEMLFHAKAVRRGVKQALMVVDLPFMTYQESVAQAMHSAGRVLKETGAQAVSDCVKKVKQKSHATKFCKRRSPWNKRVFFR